MNDLSSITDRILSDAQAEADAILDRAKSEADSMISEYREKANARKKEICDEFLATLDAERKRIESEAATNERNRVLKEKAELISRCLDTVERRLSEGYATTYAPFFLKLLEAGAFDLDATLVFPKGDKDAENFFALAKKRYAELYPGRTLGLAKEEDLPHGGFILRYEHISSPCTAKSVVDFYRLDLETRANKLLFETETP